MENIPTIENSVDIKRLLGILAATGKKYDVEKIKNAYDRGRTHEKCRLRSSPNKSNTLHNKCMQSKSMHFYRSKNHTHIVCKKHYLIRLADTVYHIFSGIASNLVKFILHEQRSYLPSLTHGIERLCYSREVCNKRMRLAHGIVLPHGNKVHAFSLKHSRDGRQVCRHGIV